MTDQAHTLTPFGVGATLEQLGSGGFVHGRPTRPVPVHGHGLTHGFEHPDGSSRITTPMLRSDGFNSFGRTNEPAGSRGQSRGRNVRARTPTPFGATNSSQFLQSSIGFPREDGRPWTGMSKHWDFDDVSSVRSVVRSREEGRLKRLLGQTVLAHVPDHTPLCVTKSGFYRRNGLVHGDPRHP